MLIGVIDSYQKWASPARDKQNLIFSSFTVPQESIKSLLHKKRLSEIMRHLPCRLDAGTNSPHRSIRSERALITPRSHMSIWASGMGLPGLGHHCYCDFLIKHLLLLHCHHQGTTTTGNYLWVIIILLRSNDTFNSMGSPISPCPTAAIMEYQMLGKSQGIK